MDEKKLKLEIDKNLKFYEVERKHIVRKLMALKSGGFMDLDEWQKIPYEGQSITEDADFEIVEQKRISHEPL